MLSRLRLAGGDYAVNRPGHVAFTQGVPKTTLEDDWLTDVMKMAERARFVVASVTPKSIGTEGFLLELEVLSNVLSHKWIMLVMGS